LAALDAWGCSRSGGICLCRTLPGFPAEEEEGNVCFRLLISPAALVRFYPYSSALIDVLQLHTSALVGESVSLFLLSWLKSSSTPSSMHLVKIFCCLFETLFLVTNLLPLKRCPSQENKHVAPQQPALGSNQTKIALFEEYGSSPATEGCYGRFEQPFESPTQPTTPSSASSPPFLATSSFTPLFTNSVIGATVPRDLSLARSVPLTPPPSPRSPPLSPPSFSYLERQHRN